MSLPTAPCMAAAAAAPAYLQAVSLTLSMMTCRRGGGPEWERGEPGGRWTWPVREASGRPRGWRGGTTSRACLPAPLRTCNLQPSPPRWAMGLPWHGAHLYDIGGRDAGFVHAASRGSQGGGLALGGHVGACPNLELVPYVFLQIVQTRVVPGRSRDGNDADLARTQLGRDLQGQGNAGRPVFRGGRGREQDASGRWHGRRRRRQPAACRRRTLSRVRSPTTSSKLPAQ